MSQGPELTAYVRIQADATGLASDAERQIRRELDRVRVPEAELSAVGNVELRGVDEAREEVEALGSAIQRTSQVTVSETFAPLLDDVRGLRSEADALVGSFEGTASATAAVAAAGAEAGAGIEEAASAAAGLGSTANDVATSISGVNDALVIARTAAQTGAAANTRLAATNAEVAASERAVATEALNATRAEDGLFRARARRGAPVGPLRLAGVGVAAGAGIFAAAQAVGVLAEKLQVGGEEAFTFEGRVRNLGAALLHGDLIGGLDAIFSRSERLDFRKTLEGLKGITDANEAATVLNDYAFASTQAAIADEKHAAILPALTQQIEENEGVMNRSAAAMIALANASRESAAANRENAQSAIDLARNYQIAQSVIDAFGVSQQTVRDAQNRPLTAFEQAQTTRVPLAPSARNRLAQIAAEASGDLGRLLALQKEEAARLAKLVENTRLNGKQREQLLLEQAQADAAVVRTQRAIANAAKSERDRLAAAADARRAEIQGAHEQELLNNEAKAALTKRKSDDIRATQATIDYFKTLVENTKGLERAQARAKLIAARGRLIAIQTGVDPTDPAAAAQLHELRLANAEARAALTDRLSDDRKAIQATIAYYRQLVKNTKGLEQEQARTQLIAARARLKALAADSGAAGGASAAEIFQLAADTFRQFGSNIASGPGGILSAQQALGVFSGLTLEEISRRIQQQQLDEQKRQTEYLSRIAANTGRPDQKDRGAPRGGVSGSEAADLARLIGAVVRGL